MENLDKLKEEAIKIEVEAGERITDVLHMLENMQKENKNVYVEIVGHKIYSADINYEEAFKTIFNMTEEEYNQLMEDAKLEHQRQLEALKLDAQNNYQKRIAQGKQLIRSEKHGLWENFVKECSQEPYYGKEVDTVIEFLGYLKSGLSVETIANRFKRKFTTIGDWYTSTILTNLAKFNPQGINLFEHLRNEHKNKGHKVAETSEYMTKLRNINILLDMGESLSDAITITNNQIVNITVDGIDHIGLINENTNLMSKKDNYMLVGQFFDEFNHLIYLIDGTNVSSYITVDGQTAQIYADGRLGDVNEGIVEINRTVSNIQDVAEEYYVAYNGYTNLDVETLIRVLKDIRELTQPSQEVVGEMILHDEMRRYKSQVISLRKSTN